jgi:putative restriction endonuclease
MTELSDEEIAGRFRSLTIWSKAGQRAPHKPLLCLLAISKLVNENVRLLPFREIQKTLQILLTDFGPPRKVCHPEYPFWALQNDNRVWECLTNSPLSRPPNGYPTAASLIRSDARGGFLPDVYEALRERKGLRSAIVVELLGSHFPETIQEDILDFLGLKTVPSMQQSNDREPDFRERVLSAYEYRCAVCGFNLRIGNIVVALEAAHIKWHQAGGPDVQENGLSLCSLHHKLFDRGAFTIDANQAIAVSEKVYGSEGFTEHLGRFHRKTILNPTRESYKPRAEYLEWHLNQVFLPPSRE